ncbi:hypothetical protein VNI00_009975 [Paramarasmius palmivorus]|uniref:Uncharacterized protein n=1 Tax=Paramarasmius palmivorus TaxID=297713 RepID=A0AAW0CMC6_9AGAR
MPFTWAFHTSPRGDDKTHQYLVVPVRRDIPGFPGKPDSAGNGGDINPDPRQGGRPLKVKIPIIGPFGLGLPGEGPGNPGGGKPGSPDRGDPGGPGGKNGGDNEDGDKGGEQGSGNGQDNEGPTNGGSDGEQNGEGEKPPAKPPSSDKPGMPTETSSSPISSSIPSSAPVRGASVPSATRSTPISSPTDTSVDSRPDVAESAQIPPTNADSPSSATIMISTTIRGQTTVITTTVGASPLPGSSLPNAGLIGGVVAGVVVLLIIILSAFYIWCKKRIRRTQKPPYPFVGHGNNHSSIGFSPLAMIRQKPRLSIRTMFSFGRSTRRKDRDDATMISGYTTNTCTSRVFTDDIFSPRPVTCPYVTRKLST